MKKRSARKENEEEGDKRQSEEHERVEMNRLVRNEGKGGKKIRNSQEEKDQDLSHCSSSSCSEKERKMTKRQRCKWRDGRKV